MGVELVTCPESPSHGLVEVKSSNTQGSTGQRMVTLACGYMGAYVVATMAPPSQIAAGNDYSLDGAYVGDQSG